MPREGDIRTIKQEYVRHECETCGAPATTRHSYLYPNARRNPASSAYGKDDIGYCSDAEAFVCDACPCPRHDGMEWCSTFSSERFAHMLHFWWTREDEIRTPEPTT